MNPLQILSLILIDIGSLDSLFRTYRQFLGNLFLATCGVYSVFAIVYSLSCIEIAELTENPAVNDLAHGVFRCISVWNYIVQIVFYISINITHYVNRTGEPNHWLTKGAQRYECFLEKSFLSLVFPLTLFVCNTFWYVFHNTRDLIYPKIVADLIPNWYNHTVHTVPVVIVFLHLILVEHKTSPIPMSTSVFIQCAFHAMYLSMLIILRYLDGVWLYKFLGYYAVSRSSQIISAILFSFVSPIVYVMMGYKTHAEVEKIVSKVNNKKNNSELLAKTNNNNYDVEWKLK
uniref:Androgen-dependent TFPI-regulating protein n=1 Tax=Cacopsylla melanoneura TaxID=428564 RepID=A0A8D8M7U1_9HEMI